MRQKGAVESVAVFVAVAEAGSFSEAARRLGVTPSAVSQAIGSLEARLNTSLFRRSTRSLSLTEVGREYLLATAPALAQLRQAAEDVSGRAGRPAGPLRLTMPRAPFEMLVAGALVAFQQAYPDVEVEVCVEARLVDIVKEGFDAGLRHGNCLEKDMVAVQLSRQSTAIMVASPDYLRDRGTPQQPCDLMDHRAIMCRSQITGLIIPWTLRHADETVQVAPPRPMVVHDLASQTSLAVRGLGILNAPEAYVSEYIGSGELRRILADWHSPIEPLFLYFPGGRYRSAPLRAFISFLRRYSKQADVGDNAAFRTVRATRVEAANP